MLIRLGFASGRQGPCDELPTMRGLAVEFALRPRVTVTGQPRGMRLQRALEPMSLLAVPHYPGPLAELPVPDGVARGVDRPARLEALCVQFLSEAGRHGFSPEEIEQTVRQIAGNG